jgi:hypothetical protein
VRLFLYISTFNLKFQTVVKLGSIIAVTVSGMHYYCRVMVICLSVVDYGEVQVDPQTQKESRHNTCISSIVMKEINIHLQYSATIMVNTQSYLIKVRVRAPISCDSSCIRLVNTSVIFARELYVKMYESLMLLCLYYLASHQKIESGIIDFQIQKLVNILHLCLLDLSHDLPG